MSLFEKNPTVRQQWVRCVLMVDGHRVEFSIRLAYNPGYFDGDGTFVDGGYEFTDYRPNGHTFIDWAWIDAHSREIFQALELDK